MYATIEMIIKAVRLHFTDGVMDENEKNTFSMSAGLWQS